MTTRTYSWRSAATRRSRWTFALCCTALCWTGVGCKKAEEPVAAASVSVQAAKAEREDLTEYVSGEAVLTPVAEAAVAPKISSPVKKFYVQRGAHVKAGQLLALLENRDLSSALTESKGGLTQAQATYETSVKAQIPEDQEKAQEDVKQTKAQRDLAKSLMDARKGLLEQGAIPKKDYETAAAAYVQADGAYAIAAQHLRALEAVGRKASLENAEGALVSAKGKYQSAEAELSYSELRSPIAGVVTDRPQFAGDMATAGQTLVTVMDTSVLIAKVHLAQSQAQSLTAGAAAEVTVPGIDEAVKGTVSLVSPALDAGSTTVEVWVKLANAAGTLKAGTPVKVRIAMRTVKHAIVVPNEAVVANKSGAPAVMVIGPDGVAKSQVVKVGGTNGKDTEILSGLDAGAQVVTQGAYGMDDGTKVKVVAAGAADDDDAAAAPGVAKGDDK
jgi:HlyD family secretion protein